MPLLHPGVPFLNADEIQREPVELASPTAASPVYRLLRLAAWFPTLMERRMVECVQHLFREPLGIEYRRNHERA